MQMVLIANNATVTLLNVRMNSKSSDRIPKPLWKYLTTHSNAKGIVRVAGVKRSQIISLNFNKPDSGEQQFNFYVQQQQLPKEIRLRKTGSVKGRLILPKGIKKDLSKVKLRIATLSTTLHGQDFSWYGHAIVYPTKEGRFQIPAIAEGTVRVFVTEPEGFMLRAEPPTSDLIVTSNDTSTLKIPLQKAVRMTRLIRNAKTKKPISGIRVHLQNRHQNIGAITDQQGKFSTWILPNVPYHTVYNIPEGYINRNIDAFLSTTVSSDAKEKELPPIELLQGRTITGTVVDSSGKPFAGIRVGVDWSDPKEDFGESVANSIGARKWGKTDAKGHFQITKVHPDVDLTITPVRAGVRLGDTIKMLANDTRPIQLQTNKFYFVSLNGRVIDKTGSPVAGVPIRIFVAKDKKAKENSMLAAYHLTDKEGRFKTKAHLPRQYMYRLSVSPQNHDIAVSTWMRPETVGTTFADMIVERSKSKAGKTVSIKVVKEENFMLRTIVDSAGKPIADAQVIAWYSGERKHRQSRKDGKFIFQNVPKKGLWIYVNAKGFRFHGEYTEPDWDNKKIVLIRDNKPAKKQMKSMTRKSVNPDVIKLAHSEYRQVC